MEKTRDFVTPLLTDMYQITMAYGYFKSQKHNQHSIFDCFFRKNPFDGSFTVFGGVAEVVKFVKNYKFTTEHITYLKSVMKIDDPAFFEWLLTIDYSKVKIYAIKEGSVVFPRENLLRIEGPLAACQLLESTVLNLVNFPSLLATNARRMKIAAGKGKRLIEFGLRRAQGPDGAMMASEFSYLGGFHGSSNVNAGFLLGIQVAGTMAHSYITSFEDLDEVKDVQLEGKDFKAACIEIRKELDFSHTSDGELAAMIAYAAHYPKAFLGLVDTFDTLNSGVPNFLVVAVALKRFGYEPIGIRLDSGNLAKLSKASRKVFEVIGTKAKADFSKLIIFASNDINEDSLFELEKEGHEIDAFGIGTNLVTCQKQPALGMVYKLVSLDGSSKIKFSEEPSKATLPGSKTVYRVWTESSPHAAFDLIALEHEKLVEGTEIKIRASGDKHKKFVVTVKRIEKLHQLVWDGKEGSVAGLEESRAYLEAQIDTFNPELFNLKKPIKYEVYITDELSQKTEALIEEKNIWRKLP